MGHTLGLAHDGTSTLGYYAGEASWAPIMGVGYGKPITQWSRGDYADANNLQDDYAVMQANGLGRRGDEAGGAAGTAAALNGTSVAGYITDPFDKDVWSVNRDCSTPFDVTVTPAPNAPDLDIRLDVLDAAGDVVETSDPPSGGTGDIATGMSAVLRDQIRPGQFYLRVDGVGNGDPLDSGYSDYGSLGAYTLTMSPWCAAVAPGAPSEPQALAVEPDDLAGTATLSWDVPVSAGGSPISGYAVTRDGFDVATLDTTVQRAKAAIWSSSRPVAACTTATGLPSSGAEAKTSTWEKEKLVTVQACPMDAREYLARGWVRSNGQNLG